MKIKSINLFRNSASLIVLGKNILNNSIAAYNYKILTLKRSKKTSFMANHIVFPGGISETADQSIDWLNYFEKSGIENSNLEQILKVSGNRPSIFQSTKNESLKREISLRITAIRETFEELGILICLQKNEINNVNQSVFGTFSNNCTQLKLWQEKVHNDPNKFLELCQTLDVIPDLWSLYEWSVWMTPATFKKRFEAAFFIVALNSMPQVFPESNEVDEYFWKTPEEYLSILSDEQIFLPPPQVYELSRMSHYYDITELISFAKNRNNKGMTLFLPVQYRCSDGIVGVLVGDDAYPKNPNDFKEPIDNSNETLLEFRQKCKNLHRSEHKSFHNVKYYLNFTPFNDHLSPVLQEKKIKHKL